MRFQLPIHSIRCAGLCITSLCLCIIFNAGTAWSKPLRLLIIGDSLTAGYGLPADQAFPVKLEQALNADGIEVQVINGGVSGDTTSGGLARTGWLLSDNPDAVMVELGANDALRGLDPVRTKQNLLALIQKIRAEGLPVLLAGMYAPPNMGREYEKAFNAVFPEVAEETGVLFMPFFLKDVAGNLELNQNDGIHPNPDGVAIVVRNVIPYAQKLLDQVAP